MSGDLKPGQYLSMHYLRAVAALMVAAVHIYSSGLVMLDEPLASAWLRRGVDIFFVISGFVMVTSTSGRAMTPGDFMRRRIARIVPLYWIMTLFWVAIAGHYPLDRIVSSLALMAGVEPDGSYISPVLTYGWTLEFEMFFYVLFALSLWLPERVRLWALAVPLLALAMATGAPGLPPFIAYYANPCVVLFVAGMAIARWDLKLPPVWMVLGFVLLATDWRFTDSFLLTVQVPVILVVLGARSLEGRLGHYRLPTMLGDASYALYLTHIVAIQLGFVLLAGRLPPVLVFTITLVLACAIAVLVHRVIEQPIARLLARRPAPGAAPPVSQATA